MRSDRVIRLVKGARTGAEGAAMPNVEDIRRVRLLLCQASCAYAEGDQGRGDELVLQLMSMTLPWTFDREASRPRPSRARRAVVCR